MQGQASGVNVGPGRCVEDRSGWRPDRDGLEAGGAVSAAVWRSSATWRVSEQDGRFLVAPRAEVCPPGFRQYRVGFGLARQAENGNLQDDLCQQPPDDLELPLLVGGDRVRPLRVKAAGISVRSLNPARTTRRPGCPRASAGRPSPGPALRLRRPAGPALAGRPRLPSRRLADSPIREWDDQAPVVGGVHEAYRPCPACRREERLECPHLSTRLSRCRARA